MCLFNTIWFIIGGWWQALGFFVASLVCYITIIGIPIGKSLGQFAKLSAFPFGKEVIRETELKGKDNVSGIRKFFGVLANVIWFPFGFVLACVYLLSGILCFITIIGIPCGIVFCRSAKFLLFPIGAKVVTKKQAYASAVANELDRRNKRR